MAVIFGGLFVIASILAGFTMAGGKVAALIHLSEFITIGGASLGSALVGFVAAVGSFLRARWATSAAWLASLLLVLTIVSSWAGIVALVGLISGRIPGEGIGEGYIKNNHTGAGCSETLD